MLEIFVPSPEFFCEPKIAHKKSAKKRIKQTYYTDKSDSQNKEEN